MEQHIWGGRGDGVVIIGRVEMHKPREVQPNEGIRGHAQLEEFVRKEQL